MAYKILIVDDSKLARMAIVKALSAIDPECIRIEAANAVDALKAMETSAPDIALLDFNMPGQDGLALVEELKKRRPEMPVAVVSANHQVEVIARAQAAGAQFLAKPVSEQSISEFLRFAVATLKSPS